MWSIYQFVFLNALNYSRVIIFLSKGAHALHAFLMLHDLVPPNKKKKTVGMTAAVMKKCTVEDSIDAFIVHKNTAAEWTDELNRRSNSKDLHPIFVLIGPQIENPTDVYICFDNIKYAMKTFPKAVVVCFKIFHVLGIRYPIACNNVWHFINKHFFDVNDTELANSSVDAFIRDIRVFKERNQSVE